MKPQLLVDTNLLVLLAVGAASPALIDRHKRTQAYTADDYLLLERLVSSAAEIVTTPHILTETSNLTRQCAEPAKSLIASVLKRMVLQIAEIHVPGREIVETSSYAQLGLTDAAVVKVQRGDITLLTDDLDLYVQSVVAGLDAINFAHLRDRAM